MTEKKKRRDTKENYYTFRYDVLQEKIGKTRVAEESIERGEKERESGTRVFAVVWLSHRELRLPRGPNAIKLRV